MPIVQKRSFNILFRKEQDLITEGINLDRLSQYPRELVMEFCQQGLLKQVFPPKLGGFGGSLMNFHKQICWLAAAYPSLACIFLTQFSFGAWPLFKFATPDQQKKFFPGVLSGKTMMTLALCESSLGTELHQINTFSQARQNGWSLSGEKKVVLNATEADYFLIVSKLPKAENDPNRLGIFIVPKDRQGLVIDPPLLKNGLASFPIANLQLVDVKVSEVDLLGGVIAGTSQLQEIINQHRLIAATLNLGIATGVYNLAVNYATQERKFGLKIIAHQTIQNDLIEYGIQLDAAKALLREDIRSTEANPSIEISKINLMTANLAMLILSSLTKFTGSYGFMYNHEIARFARDAELTQHFGGSNQSHRERIIAPLLK